ncbi:MAG: hypothetical protein HYW78_03960 [Parcubacteria group bacterium]|nr:hypothetical protein [Parcubacteria group bacterium]
MLTTIFLWCGAVVLFYVIAFCCLIVAYKISEALVLRNSSAAGNALVVAIIGNVAIYFFKNILNALHSPGWLINSFMIYFGVLLLVVLYFRFLTANNHLPETEFSIADIKRKIKKGKIIMWIGWTIGFGGAMYMFLTNTYPESLFVRALYCAGVLGAIIIAEIASKSVKKLKTTLQNELKCVTHSDS